MWGILVEVGLQKIMRYVLFDSDLNWNTRLYSSREAIEICIHNESMWNEEVTYLRNRNIENK